MENRRGEKASNVTEVRQYKRDFGENQSNQPPTRVLELRPRMENRNQAVKTLYQYTVYEHEGMLLFEQEFAGTTLPTGIDPKMHKPTVSESNGVRKPVPMMLRVQVVEGTKYVVNTSFPLKVGG